VNGVESIRKFFGVFIEKRNGSFKSGDREIDIGDGSR